MLRAVIFVRELVISKRKDEVLTGSIDNKTFAQFNVNL